MIDLLKEFECVKQDQAKFGTKWAVDGPFLVALVEAVQSTFGAENVSWNFLDCGMALGINIQTGDAQKGVRIPLCWRL